MNGGLPTDPREVGKIYSEKKDWSEKETRGWKSIQEIAVVLRERDFEDLAVAMGME